MTNRYASSVYTSFFRTLIDVTEGQWKPTAFMVDFEMAIWKSIRDTFGKETIIFGCEFHLLQAVRRYMKSMNL